MHRTFSITLPADTNYHNLFSLIVGTSIYGLAQGGTNEIGITGAIPTDGILQDRVQELTITVDSGSVFISDRNHANSAGDAYLANQSLTKRSTRNTICLKDYLLAGAAGSETLTIDLEAM